jgi:hypothetical protein
MNLDSPFDPGEALSCFPDCELYGLPQRVYFYLLMTCRAIEAFAEPSFSVERCFGPPGLTPAGCFVEFIIRQAFWIDVHANVKLWTSSADDAEARSSRYLVYDGASDNPGSWEGLLREVGCIEKFYVIGAHADALRRMWSEWLVEQKRRRDERGW